MNDATRYRLAKRVTLVGGLTNAFLGVLKIIGGTLFHSHGLVADGDHSFSDLLTDVMVLIASKYGSQDADHRHPYGHKRFETAGVFLLSLILIAAGVGIAWDAFDELIHRAEEIPKWLAVPVALLSLAVNEGLYHYTHYVGKKIRSNLILTNAWHRRADAASSLVVLAGLMGSLMGYRYFDQIAAIVVAFMIIKMGWDYAFESAKELVDTAASPEDLKTIEDTICSVDGVHRVHQLRTRLMGGDVFIDVHVIVSAHISVSEGHYIAQHVHRALVDGIEHVQDVTVHVDPEDDETHNPCFHLPNRKTLEETYLTPWQRQFPEIQSGVLHYLDGAITIDLMAKGPFRADEQFKQHLETDLTKQKDITQVRVWTEKTVFSKP